MEAGVFFYRGPGVLASRFCVPPAILLLPAFGVGDNKKQEIVPAL
jgi:hypothetical protein